MLHHPTPHHFDLEVTVNGKQVTARIPTHLRLLDFLRENLDLTGSKEVCGEGECGACTIFLNGQTVNACLILAVEVHGAFIQTIEGLANTSELTAMQRSFEAHHAVQCGYCIPGMVMTGTKLLERNPHPSRDDVKYELSGNICRCTGYHKIIDAIENAGKQE